MALREHRGVLAVLPLFAVLATNVLNAHNADNVALPEAIAVGLALLVVAGAHLDALQARWTAQRVGSLPGMRSRFATSAWVVALLLTVAALLLPPLTSTDISSHFFPGSGAGGSNSGDQTVNGTNSAPATIQFNNSTQPGGPLVSQPQRVLAYSIDTNSPVYLRVVDDTEFAGGNWYPASNGQATSCSGRGCDVTFKGVPFASGQLPRNRSLGAGGVGAVQTAVHAQIVMQPGATGNTNYAVFAGEPDASSFSGVAYGQVSNGDPNALLTIDSVRLQKSPAGTRISTTSVISGATADQLRGAGTNYPAFAQQYTQLSDDFTHGAGTIRVLARQWTAGTANPYDAAVAIEQHLRNPALFSYTLSPPAVPANEWPVVYFLVTSHRGYCQYFASAMGSMLRSLGIPTRLVNGYGSGTSQAQSGRQGVRQQTVSTSDAHTWVEAYFPGFGWIPFEPTPSSTDGNYQPIARGPITTTPPSTSGSSAGNPDLPQGVLDPVVGAAGTGGSAGAARPPIVLFVLAGSAAALVLLVLAIATWLALPRSLHGAWRRVEALGAFVGMHRTPWETHREYAQRLTAVKRLRLPAEMRDIAAVCGHAEFSPAGNDEGDVVRVLADWREVMRAVPHITWMRWRRPPA
jgi:transglutaminase-like putative cysteine protease